MLPFNETVVRHHGRPRKRLAGRCNYCAFNETWSTPRKTGKDVTEDSCRHGLNTTEDILHLYGIEGFLAPSMRPRFNTTEDGTVAQIHLAADHPSMRPRFNTTEDGISAIDCTRESVPSMRPRFNTTEDSHHRKPPYRNNLQWYLRAVPLRDPQSTRESASRSTGAEISS